MSEQPKTTTSFKTILMRLLRTIWRYWKKFRLTKWLLLLFLTATLCLTTYLVYLSKTTQVASLKNGLEQTTVIYDAEGQEAGALFNQKGQFITLSEMSDTIKETVVATEDKRFYQHNGVDLMGIARVTVGYVLNGFRPVGGGSTLTQQLAKNAYLTQKQTLLRKAQELFLAWEIEKHFSKDDILEMYLNNAYFGNGVWGVSDASLKYFGKTAAELTWSEAATLTGMLKAPSLYNPIDDYDQAITQRNIVLTLLRDNQVIDEASYQLAKDSALTLVDAYQATDRYQYPHYFDAVIDEIVAQYGIAEDDLLNKGYKIYTFLNQEYQQRLDQAYANDALFTDAADGTLLQSATVAVHPSNGGVMAIVGGRGPHVFRGFNRATQMRKQPGSTIKPLVTYTPALESGYQIDSMVDDTERSYGSDQYTPQNWNFEYSGTLPMYQALAESKNTSAVWLLDTIGLQNGINKLHQFGIPTEKEDDYLGIALGGMTKRISPIQLASAYTAFPNNGVRSETRLVAKIVDASGETVVDNTVPRTNRVTSPEVARDMTRMMLDVYTDVGTGSIWLPDGYEIAGKTGTTEYGKEASRDRWMVAYTPDMVVVTWLGFDETDDAHHIAQGDTSIYGLFSTVMTQLLVASPHSAFDVTLASWGGTTPALVLDAGEEGGVGKWLQDMGSRIVTGAQEITNQVVEGAKQMIDEVGRTLQNIFQ